MPAESSQSITTDENASGGGFYTDAAVYDALHTPGTAAEVRGLERIAARFVRGPTEHWLEPACGTGRYLRVAASRGRRVTGFDLDAGLVADARRRLARRGVGARAEVFKADLTDFAGGLSAPADLAFCTINTLRHLGSDDALRAHLAQIALALRPGGVYAVGLSTTVYGVEGETEDVWRARRGRLRVTQAVQYLPAPPGTREETVVSHLVLERPSGTEHRDSVYRLRTYTLEEWRGVVARSAMELIGCVDEDGEDIPQPMLGYAIWILKPRARGAHAENRPWAPSAAHSR